ncbi:MAG TPA: class I lanthipeptide [Thermoanaerobaculia bacterium]|nr:class I lanthipeptide [Thermoanaerobaculia bacterium]
MEKTRKKLQLNRETVRVLRDSELKNVGGGSDSMPPWWTTRSTIDCRSTTTVGCYCTQLCDGC